MDYREPSPEQHRPSEPLAQAAVADMMHRFAERIFVHGTDSPPAKHKSPKEIQYDFNTKAVERLLESTSQDDGSRVAEAYAVFERDDEVADFGQEGHPGTAVVIIINKLLTASPANNPIFQNTWYTFTLEQGGMVDASYSFEFLQGGRPVMETRVSTTMEERLFAAMHGSSDRQRPLFQDDERFLRSLLEHIGR